MTKVKSMTIEINFQGLATKRNNNKQLIKTNHTFNLTLANIKWMVQQTLQTNCWTGNPKAERDQADTVIQVRGWRGGIGRNLYNNWGWFRLEIENAGECYKLIYDNDEISARERERELSLIHI